MACEFDGMRSVLSFSLVPAHTAAKLDRRALIAYISQIGGTGNHGSSRIRDRNAQLFQLSAGQVLQVQIAAGILEIFFCF